MDFKFITVAVAALQVVICNPTPTNLKIPPVIAPDPAEINDLFTDITDVNEYKDVAPSPQLNTELNVEETVKEVEDLIRNNPKLPRLTKGEIIDIIENITKADIKEAQNVNKTRLNGQRSVMLVMPFTVGSAQDDIKELYTRTPVTHIIGNPSENVKPKKKVIRKRPTFQPIYSEDQQQNLIKVNSNVQTTPNSLTTQPSSTQQIIFAPPTKNPTTGKKPDQLQNMTSTTTTIRPKPIIQNKPKPTKKQQKPQKYTNHRYPEDSSNLYVPDNGIRVVDAPTLLRNDEYSAPYVIKNFETKTSLKSTTKKTNINDDNVITRKPTFHEMIPDNFKSVVKDLDILIKPDDENQYVAYHEQPSYNKQIITSSTAKPILNISNVADNLSTDMRDLLMNFGLLENPNNKPQITPLQSGTYAQKAEIKPESYLGFKPLPEDASTRDDMDEFLSKFGLGRNSARSQKSIAMNKPKKESGKVNFDVIPDSFKDVVKSLSINEAFVQPLKSINEIENTKHVFKPNKQNTTKDELERLSKLLEMIKILDKSNNNVTEKNLKNIDMKTLKELIRSFNGEQFVPLDEKDAPNPLSSGHNETKNDVKRQEDLKSSFIETTSPKVISTTNVSNSQLQDLEASFGESPVSTTETTSPKVISTTNVSNSQLQDLEASFGGSPVSTTETSVTTKRTGFYFLLDWNTFMEVDDQKGKRVNLRFQPYVGDSRNFLNVNVP